MIFDGKEVCRNSFRASGQVAYAGGWLSTTAKSPATPKMWTNLSKASLGSAGTSPAQLTAMKTIQNFDNRNNVLLPACLIMGQVTNPIVILPESAGLQGSASCVE